MSDKDKLRAEAEQLLQRLSEDEALATDLDFEELMQELQVHQIELELQNRELRDMQEDLKIAHDKYLNLYNLAPIGYFTFDRKGVILEVNSTGADLLGVKKAMLVNKPFLIYLTSKAQEEFFNHREEVFFNPETKHNSQLELRDKSGEKVWVQVESIAVADKSGEYNEINSAVIDITERKKDQEQINRLYQAIEQTPTMVMITDQKGKIDYINPKLSQVTGYDKSEIIGEKPDIIRSNRHGDKFYDNLWSTIDAGKEWSGEIYNLKKSGEGFWERAIISPVENSAGKVTHYIKVAEDITEKKRIKDELEYRIELEQLITNLALDFINVNLETIREDIKKALEIIGVFTGACHGAIYLTDFDNLLELEYYWGKNYCDNNICADLNLAELPWLTGQLKKFQPLYIKDIDDLSTRSREEISQLKHHDVDSLIITPMSRSGRLIGLIVFNFSSVNDLPDDIISVFRITAEMFANAIDRKKIEEKLRRSEEKYRSLLDNASDAIILANTDKKILEVNKQAEELFAYSKSEFTDLEVEQLHPEDEWEEVDEIFSKAIEEGSGRYFDTLIQRKDGNQVPVDITASVVIQDAQLILQAVFRDISERKEAEKKLEEYTKELEYTNQALESTYKQLMEEMEKGRDLHEQFLPDEFPEVEELSYGAYYQPAKKLGGDFYNVFKIDDKIINYVVDITGHGLDGAILNIFVRESINSFLLAKHKIGESVEPCELINFIYRKFCEENFPEDYFICIMLGILDLNDYSYTFSNAGFQVPALLVKNGGTVETLDVTGLPISKVINPELMKQENIAQDSIDLEAGDTVIFATDGLVEEEIEPEQDSDKKEMYGLERMKESIRNNYFLSAQLIVNGIISDFKNYKQDLQTTDDITIFALKYKEETKQDFYRREVSDHKLWDQIIDEVEEFLYQYFSDIDILLVGLKEVVCNAIEHGNKGDKNKYVSLTINLYQSHVCITVTDKGEGFDWQSKLKETFDYQGRSERGRGVPLTQLAYDYVYYKPPGNQAVLVKIKRSKKEIKD